MTLLIIFRTWLEPSKQVASFIYSTLKSLAATEVPELKMVGQQVRGILTLVKPVLLGSQYAHNLLISKMVNYLDMVVNQEISWVTSPETIVPTRFSLNTLLFGSSFTAQGSALTMYTRGMDKWIDMIMKYTKKTKTSSQVREELTKVTEQLGLVNKPVVAPEIFAQYGVFDTEITAYLNEAMIVESLEKLADELNRDMQSLTGKNLVTTRGKSLLELLAYHFSSVLTATLNLCLIYLKLLVHMLY